MSTVISFRMSKNVKKSSVFISQKKTKFPKFKEIILIFKIVKRKTKQKRKILKYSFISFFLSNQGFKINHKTTNLLKKIKEKNEKYIKK